MTLCNMRELGERSLGLFASASGNHVVRARIETARRFN